MNKLSVFSINSGDFTENSDVLAPLLAKAKAGDQAALGEIYNLYFKKIFRFVFYRVGHKQAAEDLAEEVFLKAFTKLASVNEAGALEAWLYQIARNLVIDYYRQKRATVALED